MDSSGAWSTSFSHLQLSFCSLDSRNTWKLGQQAGSGLFKHKALPFLHLSM